MRGADRQPVGVGGRNRAHSHQLGGGALAVGQVLLADLLADGDNDAFPTHHRAEAKRYRDRDLDPGGDELGRIIQGPLVVVQHRDLLWGQLASLSFIRKRSASDARYMSLRVLPTWSCGTF